MSTPLSPAAKAAQDAARQRDGKFGAQVVPESGVALDVADREVTTLTTEQVYETNRAHAIDILDRFDAAGDEARGSLRYDIGVSAVTIKAVLRHDPVFASLDEPERAALRNLEAQMTLLRRVGVANTHAAKEGARQLAAALRAAITVGDNHVRTFAGKTATEWRREAAAARKRSIDSFDRSDTDGFLTQWAANTTARRYDAKAQLASQGGYSEFPALMTTDGHLVPAKLISTRYGQAWMLLDEHGDSTGEFVTPSRAATAAKRNAAMARKGYQVGSVRTKAGVAMTDSMMSNPYFYRTDGGFDPDAEIVTTNDTRD